MEKANAMTGANFFQELHRAEPCEQLQKHLIYHEPLYRQCQEYGKHIFQQGNESIEPQACKGSGD